MNRFLSTSRMLTLCLFFAIGAAARPAIGQTPEPPPDQAANASPVAAAQSTTDDDGALDLAEPDFTVVNIPTTLRLPLHKGNFHLTHRFNGNLRLGSFGEQASELFGLDRGATIGFEFRYRNRAASRGRGRSIQLRQNHSAVWKIRRHPPECGAPGIGVGPCVRRRSQQLPGTVRAGARGRRVADDSAAGRALRGADLGPQLGGSARRRSRHVLRRRRRARAHRGVDVCGRRSHAAAAGYAPGTGNTASASRSESARTCSS